MLGCNETFGKVPTCWVLGVDMPPPPKKILAPKVDMKKKSGISWCCVCFSCWMEAGGRAS